MGTVTIIVESSVSKELSKLTRSKTGRKMTVITATVPGKRYAPILEQKDAYETAEEDPGRSIFMQILHRIKKKSSKSKQKTKRMENKG